MRMGFCAFLLMAASSLHPPANCFNALRGDQPAVLIVTSSSVEAFEEAVRGIQSGFGMGSGAVILDLASKPPDLANQLARGDIRLLITVGNQAYEAAARFGKAPILATMLLRGDLTAPGLRAPSGAVVLDLPLAEILEQVAGVLPGKTRAAMIRNPGTKGASLSALVAQAKAAGMTLKVLDCPRPDKLLELFLSLRGQADVVICPPDGTLYNSATVRPLIVASIENHLPVVGFSESFVRSGAVAAVYPDYLEVGRQTGELSRGYLATGGFPAQENPRKVKLAVNPRVAKLLGLRLPAWNTAGAAMVVVE